MTLETSILPSEDNHGQSIITWSSPGGPNHPIRESLPGGSMMVYVVCVSELMDGLDGFRMFWLCSCMFGETCHSMPLPD